MAFANVFSTVDREESMHRAAALGLSLALGVMLGACGDRTEQAEPAPGDGATQAPPPAAPADMAAALPPGVTVDMVREGEQLFGTVCVACHGAGGTGTPLAPALNDDQWLNIDGSYEGMVQVIQTGVNPPKQHPAPMPPMGGGNFNAEQVRSLAAYVYSLSHR